MLEHVLNLFLCLLELEWTELIDWLVNGWSVILQFNLELMPHSYWCYPWWEIYGKDILVVL